MKDKIICLIGESGSGKTTIAKLLEADGYNVIQSYTTRPEREANEWGHTFADSAVLQEHIEMQDLFKNESFIIACKFYASYHYWATREQYQGKGTSIYVIDPDGLEMLMKNVRDAKISTIYLKSDKEVRIDRMVKQGRSVDGVSSRVSYDRIAFKRIRCNWVVDANGSIEDTFAAVAKIVRQGGDGYER